MYRKVNFHLAHPPLHQDFHVLTFGFAAAAVAIRNCSILMLAAIYVTRNDGLFIW